MADLPSDHAVEARLRDYLSRELSRAEADFPRVELVRRPEARTRRAAVLALVSVVAVVLVGVVIAPRLPGPVASDTSAIPMGDDGLPLSIDGEPVLRDAAIAAQADAGGFLAGGKLVLSTGEICGSRSERAQLGCGEDWSLVSGNPERPSFVFTLDGAPAAPGFVRTSGASTVIRVGPPSTISRVLVVDAIAWRQPTKGPMRDLSTKPDGSIEEAFVPDFVSVLATDGVTIAGYAAKRDLLDGPQLTPGGTPSNPPQAMPIPVYGDDLATLVGHSVPGVGFVAVGATVTPAPPSASVAPSSGPLSAQPSVVPPIVDCGRISPAACATAIALARSADPEEVIGSSRIVIDDVCAPTVICDRLYPFDAMAVFVTAGADTTGWIPIEITGRGYDTPTDATRSFGEIPPHIVERLAAGSRP